MKKIKTYTIQVLSVIVIIYAGSVYAKPRIAILDFELNDITSLPNTPKELKRTASFKPLIEQSMIQQGSYEIIQVSPSAQKQENPGFGYLFRFHDVAAKLGEQYNANWIMVGQHSKPSFLFSYLMVYLINGVSN